MPESRVRFLYYLGSTLGLEIFAAPVLIIFYLQYVGYSFQEYSLAMALILAFNWVLQIPAGALADRFGRKITLITGKIIYAGAMLALLVLQRTIPVPVVALLFSLGTSIGGNGFQSMMFQIYAEMGEQQKFHKVMARGTSLSMLSGAIASVIGGYLATFSIALPMTVDLVALLAVTVVYQVFIVEPARQDNSKPMIVMTYRAILHEGIVQLVTKPSLVLTILISAVLFAGLRTGFNFYQPMLTLQGVPTYQLGWFFAGFSLVSAVAAHYFGRIWIPSTTSIWPVSIMAGFLFLPIVFFATHVFDELIMILIFILTHQVVRGMWPSYFSYQVNSQLPDDTSSRTTVLSGAGFVRSVIGALMLTVSGLFEQSWGVVNAFLVVTAISALLMSIGLLILRGIYGKHKRLEIALSAAED